MTIVDKLTIERDFLLERSMGANRCSLSDEARDTGISSNALVYFAFTGKRPTESQEPGDMDDWNACFRAYSKLPRHRQTDEVFQLLTDWKQKTETRYANR